MTRNRTLLDTASRLLVLKRWFSSMADTDALFLLHQVNAGSLIDMIMR